MWRSCSQMRGLGASASSLRGMEWAPARLVAPWSAQASSICASRRGRFLLFVRPLRAMWVWRPFWSGTPWAGAWRFRRRALLRTTCGAAARRTAASSIALRSEALQPSLRAIELATWMRLRTTCGAATSSTAFRSEAPQPSLHATELVAWTWLGPVSGMQPRLRLAMRRGCLLLLPSPPSCLRARVRGLPMMLRAKRCASATSRGRRARETKGCPLSWTGGRVCPYSKVSAT